VNRRPLLACDSAFQALKDVWQKSGQLDGWYVGRFVLMPDRVHFFAMPAAEAKPRGVWNKMWKSVTARRLAKELSLQPPVWQEDTFDHILCGVESYQAKWNYVRENPLRAGHCLKSEDWPWQGEINQLRFE
jgi:putative transposase